MRSSAGARVAALDGLSEREARDRLARFGRNELPPPRRTPLLLRVARQLAEPMAMLLVVAALVTGAVIREVDQAVAIATIVVLNACIGLFQEGKAASALEALRSIETPMATVRREGAVRRIAAGELVPGDVVLLASGDRIPADARLAPGARLEVDESILTGESVPVERTPEDANGGLVWTGTLVTSGEADSEVLETGVRTRFGRIAAALEQPPRPTPLQRELARLTGALGLAAVAIAAAVFAVSAARAHGDLEDAFLVAVALAVAAVPEGLATVVTVGLAVGVHRMAVAGAVIRRLPAVETLGCATAILTDKTGTLTENRLSVETVLFAGATQPRPLGALWSRELLGRIADAATAGNRAMTASGVGDPVDVALVDAFGRDATTTRRHLREVPFDAERRCAVSVDAVGTRLVLSLRGAPEVVIARCDRAIDPGGGVRAVGPLERAQLLDAVAVMAERGFRTIALATADLDDVGDMDVPHDGLLLVGVLGLADPVRPDAADAVRTARDAGVDVVMVTGDHPGTARRIGIEAGIASEASAVVLGADVEEHGVPPEPVTHPIYARVGPEQKLALVHAAQQAGHVVAVTGDGVNDAPALRQADIGVAMGATGSDVAREAADMVITDDRLATIVTAVREGRTIYANVRKAVDYLVAGNLSEVTIVLASLVLFPGLTVPLLPLQLLWLNLLTDGLPAIALALDPTEPGVMTDGPRRRRDALLGGRHLAELGLRAGAIAAASLAVLAVSRYAWDEPWSHARALMFTTLVAAHLLYGIVVHLTPANGSFRPVLRNRWLLVVVAVELALQAAIIVLEPARELFETATLAPREALLAAVGSVLPNALIFAVSRASRRRSAR